MVEPADKKIIKFYGVLIPDYSGACHCKVQDSTSFFNIIFQRTNIIKVHWHNWKKQYADAVSCYSFVSVVNQVISLIIIQTCLNQRKETTLMKHSNNESIIQY